MIKNLVIVESPAKAKTIEKILGKDFTVKSSFGHIRDLPRGDKGVDIENDYMPTYVTPKDKEKVVKDLKSWVKKAEEVWLATDDDREGEAISWHLCKVLKLDEDTTKRIVFREITKPGLKKAIQSPRKLDINLVNAQQARRVLDRLVGFELSALLWKKIKGKLSAGRVQSVAVKVIVDREREIKKFNTESFFKVAADFKVKNKNRKVLLKGELSSRLDAQEKASVFLNNCKGAVYTIKDIKIKPTKRRSTAPFTTSTLQQEASRKLGFSVSRTMSNAQRLYEAGMITYMRTDSVSLSETALDSIAEVIENKYGKEYVQTQRYKTKKSLAQEAHEAIRPTYVEKMNGSEDRDQQRLYELIWKRTIASQMADAQIEKTTAEIAISTIKNTHLVAKGEVIKFDGFLAVYLESTDDDNDDENEGKDESGMLPPLSVGQVLDFQEMSATERFTRSAPRFTEASLVKKLEELGIGRPSTYAPTISRITEPTRGYVVKESREGRERVYQVLRLKSDEVKVLQKKEITGAEKNKLFPSDMGLIVSDFLSLHFENIMTYSFTADIEKQFDTIATGGIKWSSMLDGFYRPFHETVDKTLKEAERANGERILGKEELTGKTILVRMSKFGAVAQIGTGDELAEGEKPKYANLKPQQSLESITLEETMTLFQLPKDLGTYEEDMVVIGAGRFGPYVSFQKKYVSIPKGEDPMSITLERAIELIEQKRAADAPVGMYKELPIIKGVGRFGPFLKWNKMFVNVPKKYDFDNLTDEEMYTLIGAKVEKEANRYISRWDKEKISIQNGRWGPFIKHGKKNVKIPKDDDGKRITPEAAKLLTLEDTKKIIKESK